MLSRVRALATLACALACCFFVTLDFSSSNSVSTSMCAYQTSRLRAAANSCIRSRYSATQDRDDRPGGPRREKPRSRPAISKLAASRLTSHSHGPGKRLVEVVHVEEQAALGGGEHAEVRQVRVTADLADESRPRGRGEVAGHDQRSAAVEGERRDEHASVAQRDELRDPARRLLLEEGDGSGRSVDGSHDRRDCFSASRCGRPCRGSRAGPGSGGPPSGPPPLACPGCRR